LHDYPAAKFVNQPKKGTVYVFLKKHLGTYTAVIESHLTPRFSRALLLRSRWVLITFNGSHDLGNADIKDKK
jgi:hypothetical protein